MGREMILSPNEVKQVTRRTAKAMERLTYATLTDGYKVRCGHNGWSFILDKLAIYCCADDGGFYATNGAITRAKVSFGAFEIKPRKEFGLDEDPRSSGARREAPI